MGLLIFPRECPAASKWLQYSIDLKEDLTRGSSRLQFDGHAVKGTLHVEGGFHLPLRHPENPKSPIVRHQQTWLNGIDVLRR